MKLNSQINQLQFNRYSAYLKSQGLSDATVKRKLSSLSSFQKFLIKKKFLNPDLRSDNLTSEILSPPSDNLRSDKLTSGNLFSKFSFRTYMVVATILILLSGLGYTVYSQTILQARKNLAYSTAASLTTPNRILSFQGRLTDSSGNPITSSTGIVFRLFNSDVGGTELYVSNTGNSQTVIPDENGIFSVVIGKSHGAGVPSTVFSENAEVWLEITAAGETMDPRQQIATVGYALNAETLQGLPPSASGEKDTVVIVDGLGNINLGETSPSIISTSGTFGLEGQAILIKATDGSGGNITINPDGAGILKLITEGAGSTAVGGFIEATNANLATGNLFSGLIRNDNRGYNFIDFTNYDIGTTTLSSRFSVDASGTVTTSIGITAPKITLSVGASTGYILQSDANGNSTWVSPGSAGIGTSYDAGSGLTRTGSVFKFGGAVTENTRLNIGNTEVLYINSANGNVGLGTTSPTYKLTIADGDIALDNTKNIYWGSGATQSYLNVNSGFYRFYYNATERLKFDLNASSVHSILDMTANLALGTSAANTDLIFNPNRNAYMYSGNLGLGTTSPTYKLEVVGSNNIFRIGDTAGNTLFSVTDSAITSNLPTSFNSSGDVSMAYNLIFTNPTQSTIKSSAPLSIEAGEVFGSSNLSLKTYNSGNVVVDSQKLVIGGTLTYSQGASNGYILQSDASGNATWVTASGIGGTYTATNGLTLTGSAFGLGGTLTQNTNLTIGNTSVLFLGTNGNVGIGTTAPREKLEVQGNLSFDNSTTGQIGTVSTRIPTANRGALDFYVRGNSGLLTNAMTITGNLGAGIGAVGIGITNPTAPLEVKGNSTASIFGNAYAHTVSINGTNGGGYGGYPGLAFLSNDTSVAMIREENGTGLAFYTGNATSGSIKLKLSNAGGLALGNAYNTIEPGANNLVVAGNVGIGTTSPSNPLHIYGIGNTLYAYIQTAANAGSAGIKFKNGNSQTYTIGKVGAGLGGADTFELSSNANPSIMQFSYDGTGYLNGNISIGKSSAPTKTLDVAGDINLTGTIFSNGTSGTSGQVLSSTGTGLQWVNASSVGGTYVFSNGLTNNGTFVGLGGTLTQDTNLTIGNTSVLFLGTNGNVGVGTTNAWAKLAVTGTSVNPSDQGIFQITTGAGGQLDEKLSFGVNDAGYSWIQPVKPGTNARNLSLNPSGGNVGIGTTSPGYRLEVNGNAMIGTHLSVGASSGSAGYSLSIQGFRLYEDVVTTSSQLFLSNTNNSHNIISFPNTNTRGLVINPIGTTETTASSLLFSTGRTIHNSDIVTVNTTQNITTTTTNISGFNFTNALTFDPTNNLLGSSINGIRFAQTFSPNAPQKDINYNGIAFLSTINQTVGTSAVTRGIYINPTLTSAPNFRGIDITNDSGFGIYQAGSNASNYFNGNVGIGTSSPTKKLDIAGDINLTGTIFSNGTSGTSGQVLSSTGTGLQWVNAASVGGTYVFSNGLTNNGTFVGLGGTLTQNTQIGTSSFSLTIGNNTTSPSLYVSSGGKIGIGTSNPLYNVHIQGAGTQSLMLWNTATPSYTNLYATTNQAYSAYAIGGFGGSGGYPIRAGVRDTVGYTIEHNTSTYMSIINGGNVGIGTTSPDRKLSIKGTTGAINTELSFQDNASATIGTIGFETQSTNDMMIASAAGLRFFSSSVIGSNTLPTNERMRILSGGNVGIGTTAPSKKLDVAGDINLTGTIFSNGTSGTSGQVLSSTGTGLQWVNASSVGGTYVFSNGLTNYGSFVGLGGTLSQNTNLDTNGFNLNIGQGNTQALFISAGGNVGIGTTNPGYTLDVNGNFRTAYGNLKIISSGGIPFVTSTTGKNLRLTSGEAVADSNGITINAGNVGIGTTSPVDKLEVNGGASITGGASINGLDGLHFYYHVGTTTSFITSINEGSVYRDLAIRAQNTRFFAGSEEILYLKDSNNFIGIGTTSPTKKLDIVGDINLTGTIFSNGTSGTFGQVLSSTGTGLQWVNASSVGGTYVFNNGLTNYGSFVGLGGTLTQDVRLNIGNTEVLFLKNSNGYIGIGTTSPGTKLNINGTNPTIRIDAGTSDYLGTSLYRNNVFSGYFGLENGGSFVTGALNGDIVIRSENNLHFASGGASSKLTLLSSGNVGIGTTNPSQKLDVNGSANIGSSLAVGTNLTVSGNTTIAGTFLLNNGNNPGTVFTMKGNAIFDTGSSGQTGITVQGRSGQTANLQTWTNNSSLVLASVSANGDGYFSGNLGLGTTAPSKKLDIAGDINLTGTIFSNGTSGTSGQVLSSTGTGLQWISATGLGQTYSVTNGLTMSSNIISLGGTLTQNTNLTVGNTSVLFLGINGNVGIGTTNVLTKQEIVGRLTVADGESSGAGQIYFGKGNYGYGGTYPQYIRANSGNWYFTGLAGEEVSFDLNSSEGGISTYQGNFNLNANAASKGIMFRTQATNQMYLNNFGSLGLGTTNPAVKLDIIQNVAGNTVDQRIWNQDSTSTASHASLELASSGSGGGDAYSKYTVGGIQTWSLGIDNSDSDKFKIASTNTLGTSNDRLTIDTSGNVGIGTTAPTKKLDITGDINLTGTIFSNGTSGTSGQILSSTGTGLSWIDASGVGTTKTYYAGTGLSLDVGNTFSLNLGSSNTWTALQTFSGSIAIGSTNLVTNLNADLLDGFHASDFVAVGTTGSFLYTASNGITQVGNDFRLGGALTTDTRLNIGNTEVLFLSTNGNVGIGTTAPTQKLEVAGDALLTGNSRLYMSNTSNYLYGTTNLMQVVGQSTLDIAAANYLNIKTTNSNALFGIFFSTANTERMRIDNTGNVGIGTTAPSKKLDIAGDINLTGTIFSNGTSGTSGQVLSSTGTGLQWVSTTGIGGTYTATNGLTLTSGAFGLGGTLTSNTTINTSGFNLNIGQGNTQALFISSSGNVGIGTTNPSYKLDVAGAIRLGQDTSFYMNGASTNINHNGSTWLQPYYNAGYNTAIYSGNSSTAPKMVILAGGNVGIGNTNPTAPLHITGSVAPLSIFERVGNANAAFQFKNGAGNINFGLSAGNNFGIGASTSLDTNPYFYIVQSTGNVGIGTTNPTQKLDINGSLNIGGSMAIGSTQLVTNLNADLLDGLHASSFVAVGTTGSFLYTAGTGLTLSNTNVFSVDYDSANLSTTGNKLTTIQPINTSASPTFARLGLGSTSSLYLLNVGDTASFNNLFASGNMGIGTTAPSKKLDVTGDINLTGTIFSNGTSGTSGQVLSSTGTGLQWVNVAGIGGTYTATNGLTLTGSAFGLGGTLTQNTTINTSGFNLNIGQGNTQALFISAGGNVGVGTTAPGSTLDVNGTIRLSIGGTYGTLNSDGTYFNVYAGNNTAGLRVGKNSTYADTYEGSTTWIRSSKSPVNNNSHDLGDATHQYRNLYVGTNGYFAGNVGIGTTNPSKKLDITGDVNLTGTIFSNGTSGTSGQVLSSTGTGLSWIDAVGIGGTYTATNGLTLTGSAFGLGGTLTQNTTLNTGGFNLNIGQGNTQPLFISAGGNVGIGTTNPLSMLQISSPTSADPTVSIRGTSTNNNAYLHFISRLSGVDKTASLYTDWNGNFVASPSSGKFAINTTINTNTLNLGGNMSIGVGYTGIAAPTNGLIVQGNVGIGTSAPTGRLTVSGTSGDSRSVSIDNREIKFKGDGVAHMSIYGPDTGKSFITFQNTSTNGNVGITGADLFTILSSGNVGIGTTSPTKKLDIVGDINLTGTIFSNGTSGTSGYILSSTGTGLQWISTSGIGQTYNVDNGLHLTGSVIGLGGSITENTRLNVGNTEVLYFSSAGNVGIGMTNPLYKFTVSGTQSNVTHVRTVNLTENNTTTVLAVGSTFSDADSGRIILWGDGTSRNIIGVNATSPQVIYIDSAANINATQSVGIYTPNLYVSSNGRVGINTTDNTAQLTVNGDIVATKFASIYDYSRYYLSPGNASSNSSALSLHGNGSMVFNTETIGGTQVTISASSSTRLKSFYDGFSIATNVGSTAAGATITWSDSLFVKNNGNVGIGMTAPSTPLHVSGAIRAGVTSGTSGQYQLNLSNGVLWSLANTSNSSINYSHNAGTAQNFSFYAPNGINVGIGTTNPSSKLHVYNTSSSDRYTLTSQSSVTGEEASWLGFRNNAGTLRWTVGPGIDAATRNTFGIYHQTNTRMPFYINESDDVYLGNTYNSPDMTLLQTGNVGIGTTAPSEKLNINEGKLRFDHAGSNVTDIITLYNYSQSEPRVRIGYTGGGAPTSGYISLASVTNEKSIVLAGTGNSYINGGNVGIGTTAPSAKLEVAGDIALTNNTTGTQITVGGKSGTAWPYTIDTKTGAYLRILSGNAGASPFVMDSDGKIGIGTTTPFASLDVTRAISGGTPATSGTTDANVITRLRSTGAATLDFGMLANGDSWIQPRNPTNFSGNYNLLLSPNGGNVGIGTTSPNQLLTIGNSANKSGLNIRSGTDNNGLYLTSDGAGQAIISGGAEFTGSLITDTNAWTSRASAGASSIRMTGGQVQLFTDGSTGVGSTYTPTQRMVIDGSGNVGIGTTAPAKALTIVRGSEGAGSVQLRLATSDLYWWDIGREQATGDFQIIDTSSNVRLNIDQSTGYIGVGTTNPGTLLHIFSDNASPLKLERTTAANSNIQYTNTGGSMFAGLSATGNFGIGNSQNLTTAYLTVLSTGNVGIGTTTPGTHRLSVVGTAGLSTGTAWTNTSDYRLKNIENELTGSSLDKLMALRPVSFRWNELHQQKFGSSPDKLNIGFIAQEVEAVIPDMITTDSEGYKWYNPSGFEALLTAGVQELNIKLEDLSITPEGQVNVEYNVSAETLASLGYQDSKNEIESAIYSHKINTGFIKTINLVAQNIIAETTKSKVVKTDIITPLDDITDTIVIDGNIKANSADVSSLKAAEATIGTIYADKVISKEGEFGQVMTDKITALRDEIRAAIASTENPVEATPSAILAESAGWTYDVATSQVTVTGDMSLTDNLVVGSKLIVVGDTQLGNAFVTGTFTAGEVAIKDNFIETTNTALYIQPSGLGSVNIMNNALVIAENGEVTINGNLTITGNLAINNIGATQVSTESLFANLINAEEINTKKINVATDSASAPIIAESGFAQLATNSAQVDSNAAAGIATLPAGKTELIINNTKITPTSIIYLTPAGSTNNQVVYLKSKTTTGFTIAIDQALPQDININWWIIN